MKMGLDYDWFPGEVPENAILGESVYLDSSYGFAGDPSSPALGAYFGYLAYAGSF